MILDYTQSFSWTHEFKINSDAAKKNSLKRYQNKLEIFNESLKEHHLYHNSLSRCPFCIEPMKWIHGSAGSNYEYGELSSQDTFDIYYCVVCGYWSVREDNSTIIYGEDLKAKHIHEKFEERAILNQFDPTSSSIPIEVLGHAIKRNPELMYKIAPTKMEEIVQQVFKDFFKCDVIHCGRSYDGGIDLLVVDCDSPIIVQVKRRENPNFAEPVSLIHRLLGSMFIKSSKRGIFVSTANRFSPASKKVRSELLNTNKLDYFELVDFDKFCNIMTLTGNKLNKPWNKYNLDLTGDERHIFVHDLNYFDYIYKI